MTVMGSETRVGYVLDKSGSMTEHWQAAMDGTNQYMAALNQQDPETRVSITFFDTEVYPVLSNIPVREVTELTPDIYVPGGQTALYDAVGSAVASLESEANPGDIVMVAIFTDGYENASVEFSKDSILSLINTYKAKGWTFSYMGANQDAWAVADSIGIEQSNAVMYSTRSPEQLGKAGRIQADYLRRLRENPDSAGTLFSTRDIQDEPEPDQQPDNQHRWWKRK